jgi:preprotein translocase subunit SecA
MIQTVDQHWVKHLTDLDELREGIGLRAYAQRDPLVAYRTEASRTYEEMLASIREQVSHRVFSVQFTSQGQQPQRRQQPQQQAQAQRTAPVAIGGKSAVDRAIERGALKTSGGSSAASAVATKPKPSNAQKLGRNDPCPFCDSGKKLKHCDCEGARKWRGEL